MTLTRRRLQLATFLVWACALPAYAVLPTVPSPVTETSSLVGVSGLLQAGLGMLLVLGLIFLFAWMAKRFGLQRLGGSQVVKVISSSMLGQRERVVVVEVGTTWLVLGVTAGQINTLHTLPAPASSLTPTPPDAGSHGALGLFAQQLRDSLNGKPRAL